MRKFSFLILAILVLVLSVGPASAQSSGPVYIVQPGDTLYSISLRFGVTVDELMAANNITNPNLLSAGQQLVIPGLEGVTGVLDTEVIAFGDSLRGLLRRTQMPLPLLQKLNRLVSPMELYVGASLIIPQRDETTLSARAVTKKGETLLEVAVRQGSDPWTLVSLNGLAGTWDALPGDSLYSPGGSSDTNTNGLPDAFISAEVKSLPLKQGGTAIILVRAVDGATLGGLSARGPERAVRKPLPMRSHFSLVANKGRGSVNRSPQGAIRGGFAVSPQNSGVSHAARAAAALSRVLAESAERAR